MITIDASAPEPPFEQVRAGLAEQVRTGQLAPGTRLPTVRSLAAELGIATNTVARAYRELEALGLIETRGRAGSVVTGESVERSAREAAREYVDRVRSLGIDDARAVDLVHDFLRHP